MKHCGGRRGFTQMFLKRVCENVFPVKSAALWKVLERNNMITSPKPTNHMQSSAGFTMLTSTSKQLAVSVAITVLLIHQFRVCNHTTDSPIRSL